MTVDKLAKSIGRATGEAIAADPGPDRQQLSFSLRSAEDEELAEAELEAQQEVPDRERSEQLLNSVRRRLAAASDADAVPTQARLGDIKVPAWRASGATGSRRTRAYLWTTGASAMAVAAALYILPAWRTLETIPRYALELQGDARHLGTATPLPEETQVAFDSAIDIVLRPATAAHRDLAVRSYALREGRLEPLAASLVRSPEGTLRLHQTVNTLLPLRPGRWELVFVLAPQGKLPSQVEVERRLATSSAGVADSQASWQLMRHRINIVSP